MNFIKLFRKDLSFEALDWVNESIITENQASKILSRYNTQLPDSLHSKKGYSILLSLASFLIGLAILVIIGENWENIPRFTKMFSIISLVLLTNLIGFYFQFKRKLILSHSFFILASILYGAGIFLIAQIYHIEAHYPNGVLYWAMGVLPFALLLKSKPLLFMTQTLACVWVYLEVEIGYYPFTFFLFIFSFYYFLIKLNPSRFLFLINYTFSILFIELSLSHFFYDSLAIFNWHNTHLFSFISILITGIFISYLIQLTNIFNSFKMYSDVLFTYSVSIGIFILFIFSYKYTWKELIESASSNTTFIFLNGFLLSSFLVSFYILLYKKCGLRFKTTLLTYPVTTAVSIFYILVCFNIKHFNESVSPINLQFITNIFIFLIALRFIHVGLLKNIAYIFYVGICILLTQVFFRYFDLIGSYIGASALFFSAGLVLILAANFWKRHQVNFNSSEVSYES